MIETPLAERQSFQQQPVGPKVYKAVLDMKRKIGAVGKNGRADQSGGAKYEYRKFDDVLDAVAPLLNDHNLLLVPTVLEFSERQVDKKHFVTMRMRYQLFAEDGSFIEGSAVGEAFDVGDKASTKAQTVALRIFFCSTFNIAYEEMTDPESGEQSTWTKNVSQTYGRIVTALDSMQDSRALRPLLEKMLSMHNNRQPNGDMITTEDLEASIEVFTATARRMRFSEDVVKVVKDRIRNRIDGVGNVAGVTGTVETKDDMAVEPVRLKELVYDFQMASTLEAYEKLVTTTVQSFRSEHITRDELSELASQHCPENASRGAACYFLGAIVRCDTAAELAQTVTEVNQAAQQQKMPDAVARALTNLAQNLIDKMKGASNGHE